MTIPRNTIIGTAHQPARAEAEHFGQCPRCGAWVDRRDLGAVLDHNSDDPCPRPERPQ